MASLLPDMSNHTRGLYGSPVAMASRTVGIWLWHHAYRPLWSFMPSRSTSSWFASFCCGFSSPSFFARASFSASLMPTTAPMPYMSENMPSKPLLYVTGRFVGGAPAAPYCVIVQPGLLT